MLLDRTEETLAVIKPDAFARANEVQRVIKSRGFEIIKEKDVELTLEETGDFYIEHYGKPFYKQLKSYVGSGKIRVMILQKYKAISAWRKLIGPTDAALNKKQYPGTLRARFGTDTRRNAVHGSENFVEAEREISFFFPDHPRRSLNEEVTKYLDSEINPILVPALQELFAAQPAEPVSWLANRLVADRDKKS